MACEKNTRHLLPRLSLTKERKFNQKTQPKSIFSIDCQGRYTQESTRKDWIMCPSYIFYCVHSISHECNFARRGGSLVDLSPLFRKIAGSNPSSHHVGTLGKSFTPSCLWRRGVGLNVRYSIRLCRERL